MTLWMMPMVFKLQRCRGDRHGNWCLLPSCTIVGLHHPWRCNVLVSISTPENGGHKRLQYSRIKILGPPDLYYKDHAVWLSVCVEAWLWLIFLVRDVIYTSRTYSTMSSVRLSVTEVHWRIIANLGFKFRSNVIVRRGHLNNNIAHYASHC